MSSHGLRFSSQTSSNIGNVNTLVLVIACDDRKLHLLFAGYVDKTENTENTLFLESAASLPPPS